MKLLLAAALVAQTPLDGPGMEWFQEQWPPEDATETILTQERFRRGLVLGY